MIESTLLGKFHGYIYGKWVDACDGKTMPVVNPATGELLAEVPDMGEMDTVVAIAAADHALATPPDIKTRRAWLKGLGDALLANKEELGRIITLEHGKPHAEGIGEIVYGASFFHFLYNLT